MNKQQKHLLTIPIFCLLIVLGLAGYTQTTQAAPCNVSGLIQANTTWSPNACNPYIVTGNIIVNNGARLTIQPGTNIKFNGGMSLTVRGELVARGTSSNRITFTSNQTNKAAGDWAGVVFEDTSVDATLTGLNYISGSIIQYATIEYATTGIELDTAYPFINNNTIRFNHKGIHAERDLGDNGAVVIISNNSITDNGLASGDGITRGGGIHSYRVQLRITQNAISRNRATQSGGGIYIDGAYGDNNIIDGNLIENNNIPPYYFNTSSGGGGIAVYNGGSIEAYNNTIQGNMATGSLGGSILFGGMAPKNIRNNVVRNNTAKAGGGLFFNIVSASYEAVQVINNTITDNTATEAGGGVYTQMPNVGDVFTFAYNDIFNNIGQGQPNDFTTTTTQPFREDIIAVNNWWGTTNRTTIESHITHAVDDASLGLVVFEPFCTSPCEPPQGTLIFLPMVVR